LLFLKHHPTHVNLESNMTIIRFFCRPHITYIYHEGKEYGRGNNLTNTSSYLITETCPTGSSKRKNLTLLINFAFILMKNAFTNSQGSSQNSDGSLPLCLLSADVYLKLLLLFSTVSRVTFMSKFSVGFRSPI
jgi:hypothetical protein